MRRRFTASLLGTLFGASLLALGTPGVEAGSKGRKNTTIAIGAVALHQLLTGKTTNGLIAGAGAAYAYKRYQDAREDEKERERYR
jgi:hypothetical protein